MKQKITNKQNVSKMCFVCGVENDFGLKASFYELENNELVAIFRPLEIHQSYTGRMHGGIANAILDEAIGRAMLMNDPQKWGVTVELNVRYKKPIPLDQELRVVTRIDSENRRFFEGSGEILLENGEVAATGKGKYLKLPIDKITKADYEAEEWVATTSDTDPTEIDI
jgi:acyl-coenzyme A thioesterase PaaI-like protein